MLSLFVAFGISACSLGNDDTYVDCGAYTNVVYSGFPLLCNYSVKTQPNNASVIVITSQDDMDKYFPKHANSCTVASNPNIDFTKQSLIGVFSGAKPTSGYVVKIASIVENKCEVIVNILEKSPAVGETTAPGTTYPSDYVLIPKTSKAFIFNKVNEIADNIVIGSFFSECEGTNCQKFYQINDFSIQKFLGVANAQYDFGQYIYTVTPKKGDYALLLKSVPAEIIALKGKTKTYGTPDSADQGGIYFELRQGGSVTKIYIDNNDTEDQSAAIIGFKNVLKNKITSLN